MVHIIKQAAPDMYQDIHLPPVGHPDILPALLACPPTDKADAQDDQQQADQQQNNAMA